MDNLLFFQQSQTTIQLLVVILFFFLIAGFLTQIFNSQKFTPPFYQKQPFNTGQAGGADLIQSTRFFPYLTEGHYIIRGSRTHEFCSDDPTGLICNRNFVKDWERFYVKPLGKNTYALRGGRASKWCRVAPTGLICDADDHSSLATHFRIHGQGRGNRYVIRSILQDPHLKNWCADYGNGIRCDHQDFNSMEIFIFDKVSTNFEGGDEKRWGPIRTF